MSNKLAVIGAGGHGKVVADLAEELGFVISFFDDTYPAKKKLNIGLLGEHCGIFSQTRRDIVVQSLRLVMPKIERLYLLCSMRLMYAHLPYNTLQPKSVVM